MIHPGATQPTAGCERCGGDVAAAMIDGRTAVHCETCGIIAVADPDA